MTTTLLGIALAASPFVAIAALLRLADRVARRRAAGIEHQIALTDAIHRDLGAVAAPTVRKHVRGGWIVAMTVPLERPATVAALVGITERVFAPAGGGAAERLRIVLTPRAPSPAAALGASQTAGRRPARPAAPVATALP
jgi:hypothetical protein